ncbi:MAG: proton-conducting membrane transporter [Lachnospiraceae bacterium]|nr:proton-conducting membrane transporter [Lachnospiraceae bacterium]
MLHFLIGLVIILPMLAGVVVFFLPFRSRKHMEVFLMSMVILTSVLVWYLILRESVESFVVVYFTGNLQIKLEMDGLSKVFAGLISVLWPFSTLYSFEYMQHEKHEKVFFLFYTVTYGVTLGIALAGNLLTMYFFYELLTLSTVPLVIHTLSREAILAARKYLYYSLGGAAFGFIALIFSIVYGDGQSFAYGGILDMGRIGDRVGLLQLVYVLAFFGFGVKAALCPFNSWLPDAGVAPTPVTALLHAVAVVKAGAFAIIRLTYYVYGADFLKGTTAQYIVMAATIFTILYGSVRALKQTHFKRRLAYSTIANMSYILFGVTLMSPLGLAGALCHLIYHAIIKITAFFCAGAVITKTGKTYIYELDGLGRRMPVVFGTFTVAGLGLLGMPGTAGFISKWELIRAAFENGTPFAVAGVAALLISALLTSIYMLTIPVRAFFPARKSETAVIGEMKRSGTGAVGDAKKDDRVSASETKDCGAATVNSEANSDAADAMAATDPGWHMLVPLLVFSVLIVVCGVHSGPVVELLEQVAAGLM